MRIIEQIQTAVLGLTDQFIIDGSTGTRAITFENLLKAINQKISWMSLWGENIPVEARRNIWRGKNLGTEVTQTQWNEIKAGTFKNLFLGDYWEMGGRIWRIVDFDYWMNAGDTSCSTHHLVIMPDRGLYIHVMNDTDTTEGGYVGSKMYREGLAEAKSIVNGTFGADHVLVHRELLCNGVTDGHASSSLWIGSTVELPNEIMMYGCYVLTGVNTGIAPPHIYTIDKTQLAGMKVFSKMINPLRQTQWLRDVATSASFAYVSSDGAASWGGASYAANVRPVLGIKGLD